MKKFIVPPCPSVKPSAQRISRIDLTAVDSLRRRSRRIFHSCIVAVCAAASLTCGAADFFVAPSGSSGGDGSVNRPWNFQTALSHPGSVRPGDTIWLRGGVYFGRYTSSLTGRDGQPITVRQYPGEQAIIDGSTSDDNTFTISGAWANFWGFEVRNSSASRPHEQWTRPHGVTVLGPNTKCINLIVHDNGQGFGAWSSSSDAEIYGCVIYNNGNTKFDHGIYTQNQLGTKRIRDNIIFNNYGYGLHIYGSENAYLHGYDVEGNTIFNNGSLSQSEAQNVIIGGGNPAERIRLQNNYTYSGFKQGTVSLGSVNNNRDLLLQNNYFVDFLCLDTWQSVTLTDNTVITPNTILELRTSYSAGGTPYNWDRNTYFSEENAWKPFNLRASSYSGGLYFSDWRNVTGRDGSSTYTRGRPGGNRVFVRPNVYEPGRANITVYNWSRQSAVSVDLSSFLPIGTPYEIRNAQNYLAAPILSGTYFGGLVSLPMYGLSVAQPYGLSTPAPMGPDFNVFVVLPIAAPLAAANTAPTLSSFSAQIISEDSATGAIPFIVGDAETSASSLSVLASSSNPSLVPNGNIRLEGSGSNRTITVTPAPNQSGSATINVTVSDGALLTSRGFSLTVNPVNDAPTISAINDVTVFEDLPTDPIGFLIGDMETSAGSLSVGGSSSDQRVLSNANIRFGGSGANRTVTLIPSQDQSGAAVVSIVVSDGSQTATRTFLFTVQPANDAPSISPIPNQSTNEDTATPEIGFTIGDPETPAESLAISVTSSNPALVPVSSVRLGGASANRTLVITPAPDQSGSSTLTITISDGASIATSAFTLTVNPDNDAPSISSIPNQTINQDTATSAISFTIGDVETPADALVLQGSSSNAALIPGSNIRFGGSGANRSVTVTPASGQSGSATISVIVSDGLTSRSTTFTLTVNAVVTQPPPAEPTPAPPVLTGKAYLSFEAEAGALAAPMSVLNDALASQGKYIASATLNQGTASFTLNIQTAGEYVIWCRVLAKDGADRGNHDSFFVSMDGAEDVYDVAEGRWSNDWQWTQINARAGGAPLTVNPRKFNLTAGSHTLTFRGRETMTLVDAIIVTNDREFVPSGASAPAPSAPTAPVNTAPTISTVNDQSTSEDTATAAIGFSVGDAETSAGSLTVTASSSNSTLISLSNMNLGGTGANRTITIAPAPNQYGSATISLAVSDGALTTTRSFALTVSPVNDAPSISSIANQTINQDTASAAISFNVGDVESSADSLTLQATSSNPTLIPNSNIRFSGSGGNRSVTVTPAAGQSGSATISVAVSDGSANSSTSFSVTVNPSTASGKVTLRFEAEAGALTGPMAVSSDTLASQGRYIASSTLNQGTATFNLSIPTAGEYLIWCRVLAKDGPDRGNHDSFFVSMDGAEDVYDVAEGRWSNDWQWTRVNGRAGGSPLTLNPRKFNLSAGSHTLVFRGRETVTILDSIVITNDPNFVPPAQ